MTALPARQRILQLSIHARPCAPRLQALGAVGSSLEPVKGMEHAAAEAAAAAYAISSRESAADSRRDELEAQRCRYHDERQFLWRGSEVCFQLDYDAISIDITDDSPSGAQHFLKTVLRYLVGRPRSNPAQPAMPLTAPFARIAVHKAENACHSRW